MAKRFGKTDSSKLLVNFEDITCPICLDIYQKPVSISCGHIFCSTCLKKCEGAEPACPMCRSTFNPANTIKAKDIQKKISSHKGLCSGCQKIMAVSKLRNHYSTCKNVLGSVKPQILAAPEQETETLDDETPNRHTFSCPYCGLRNFDVHSLRDHCTSNHRSSSARVVCPICASMPWGNPDQTSSDFICHLNHRHRFEYDTFVDYNIDDDTALERALAASQQEK